MSITTGNVTHGGPLVAAHPGTRKCYNAGCREPACVTAFRRWRKDYDLRALRAGGRVKVPAAPVREHVTALSERMSHEAIAALAGVSTKAVKTLAAGAFENVRPRTAQRILAVRPDAMPEGHWVSAIGATRRVQALQTLGWTLTRLNVELGNLGNGNSYLRQVATGDAKRVNVAYHRRVCEMYDRLWRVTPTSADRHERSAISAAKARAKCRGWAPPLAWDDDTIDDPNAEPAGMVRDTLTPSQRHAENAADLLEHDPFATLAMLAERLGMTANGLHVALVRAGRTDLRDKLNRNAELAGFTVKRAAS